MSTGSTQGGIENSAGGALRVRRRGNILIVDVPATGPLHPMAAFWLVFALVFTPVPAWAVAGAVSTFRNGLELRNVGGVLVLAVSLVAGLAVWLAAIHWNVRRARIMVVGDWLRIICKGALPTRQRMWPRAGLGSVRVEKSNVTCGNQHLSELRIRPRAGPQFGLLAGRPTAELYWLAELLTRELRLDELPKELPAAPAAAPGRAPAGPGASADPIPALVWGYGGLVHGATVNTAIALVLWAFWACFYTGGFSGRAWQAAPWWLAGGAGSGLVLSLAYSARMRSHRNALTELCAALDFRFQPNVDQTALGDFQDLPLLTHWAGGQNFMHGQWDGTPIWVLDCRTVYHGGHASSWYNQTIALLLAPAPLPAFNMRPTRRWHPNDLFHPGIKLAPGGAVLGQEGHDTGRFARLYHLDTGRLSARLAREAARSGPEACFSTSWEVRQLFTPAVIAFWAHHPGWWVQCDGAFLALWHHNKIVRAADRPHFIAEVLQVFRTLTQGGPAG